MRARRPSTRYASVRVPLDIRKYLHEFIDIHGYLHLDILFKMDIYWRISIFDLGISISIYLDIIRDIHMYYLDICMWITVQDVDIY